MAAYTSRYNVIDNISGSADIVSVMTGKQARSTIATPVRAPPARCRLKRDAEQPAFPPAHAQLLRIPRSSTRLTSAMTRRAIIQAQGCDLRGWPVEHGWILGRYMAHRLHHRKLGHSEHYYGQQSPLLRGKYDVPGFLLLDGKAFVVWLSAIPGHRLGCDRRQRGYLNIGRACQRHSRARLL